MRVGHCVRSAFHGIPGGKNGPARAVARGILAQPESAVPTQRLRKGGGGGDTGGRALSCGLISRLSPKGPASSRHPLPPPSARAMGSPSRPGASGPLLPTQTPLRLTLTSGGLVPHSPAPHNHSGGARGTAVGGRCPWRPELQPRQGQRHRAWRSRRMCWNPATANPSTSSRSRTGCNWDHYNSRHS